MKKIIVTTAICTAFFSTMAYADSPTGVQPSQPPTGQPAGQTAEEIAKAALGKVDALDKKVDLVSKTADEAKGKADQNETTINDHTEKLKGIEKNKDEIARIDTEVKTKLETFRNVGVGNSKKIDEAVEKVNIAVQDIDQVKENANKVPGLEKKVNGYDQKIEDLSKKIDEKAEAGALTGAIGQAQEAQVQATEAKGKAEAAQKTADKAQQTGEKAQQTAEKAEETAKTATQNVDKFDKEIQSLRNDIQNAMGSPKGSVMKEMNELRNQTNKGLAKVTALAGLHPLAFDKNNKLSLSVASGSYNSEHALALGGFYQPNRDVLLSFASSMSGNDNAYTFGASIRLGSHSKTAEKQHVSQVAELYAAIAKLQAQVEQQQQEIVQLQRVK